MNKTKEYKWGKVVTYAPPATEMPIRYTEISNKSMKKKKLAGELGMEFARKHDLCCVTTCPGMGFPYCYNHDAP